jgi:U4/U6.U5 tri-snRNP-associated protein 2
MLDLETKAVLDLSKKLYLPGYVGLNNIKANDYVNVVFQALAHVRPLRNHFLLSDNLFEYSPLGIYTYHLLFN